MFETDKESLLKSCIRVSNDSFDSNGMFKISMLNFAIPKLLEGCDLSWAKDRETPHLLLKSCFQRGDIEKAKMFINDWSKIRIVNISCFVPGTHYYVSGIDGKFDSFESAREALRRRRWKYGGLIEKFTYANEGD